MQRRLAVAVTLLPKMNAFKGKPAALFLAVFVLSSVLTVGLAPSVKPVIITVASASAVLCVVVLILRSRRQTERGQIIVFCVAFVLLATALAAFLMYISVDGDIIFAYSLIGTEAEIEAVIGEVKHENVYSGTYIAHLTAIGGEEVSVSARLETEFAANLSVGDEITAWVSFSELTDEGAYDEKTNSLRDGVTVHASVSDRGFLKLTGERKSLIYSLDLLRERISAVLAVSAELSGGDGGLASALLVGDKTDLDGTLYRDFRYVGISHLLAVSGMHLSIIIGGLERLLTRLTLHKTPRTLILIVATLLYMGLTGFSASVLRAGLMLIIYYLAYLCGREADRMTSLALSAAIIIVFFPFAAADTGLILSFFAMLACNLAADAKSKRLNAALLRLSERGAAAKLLSSLVGSAVFSLTVSLSALIFTLPVMWLRFGRISLLSPVGTLLLSIPVTAVLALAPLTVITFRIPLLWGLFAYPCAWISRICADAASVLSKLDGAELLLPAIDGISAFVLIIIAVCIILIVTLPKKAARVAGCVAFAVFFALTVSSVYYRVSYDENTVFYLNNGKNEAFVAADGASALVVDISNGGSYIISAAVEVAREELRTDVDAYMLTHLHRRHVASVRKLFESEYIDTLFAPVPTDADGIAVYGELAELCREFGVTLTEYISGEVIKYGDIEIDTASAYIERSEQPVLLLAFESERTRTAYIGSSVHESELYSLALDVCRNSDAIVFGIHGPAVKSGADYFLTESQSVTYATDEIEKIFSEYRETD